MIGARLGYFNAGGAEAFSFGNALKFDGVDDRVSIPNINVTDANGCFTINIWTKFNAPLTTTTETILAFNFNSNVDNANNYRLSCYASIVALEPRFGWFFDGYAPNTVAQNYLSLGVNEQEFYMLTLRKTTTHIEFIFNADFATMLSAARATNKNLNAVGGNVLGTTDNGSSAGEIWCNEMSIYNKALTNQQIQDLYNNGNGADARSIDTPTIYYKFNEADGATTLIDEQGSYNGTLNNFSTPPPYFVPH